VAASAELALLDDVHRHRLRRAALHVPPRRSERGPSSFSDRLLDPIREFQLLIAFYPGWFPPPYYLL
jgi:hypothetical protein